MRCLPVARNDACVAGHAAMVLAVLRRIEQRGAIETAHRARENCSQMFRYAVATQLAQRDPTVDLRGAIPPAKVRHFHAVIEPKELGLLLRALRGYEGSFIVKCAMRLAPMVCVRPSAFKFGINLRLLAGPCTFFWRPLSHWQLSFGNPARAAWTSCCVSAI